jgi:serine/threonine protein kinase/Tol biopolymer transport system component
MTLERDYILKDRYRILEILGQGGMGAVYIARDENLGVEVAVKENFFTSDEYSRQFRREATILATMRHPNLPRVSDHFEIEEQGQYMVMDYIEGEDLRQRMDRLGSIPDEEVIVIGAAICEALQYLHTRQPAILHRDIKPGNIKVNPQGAVYLVDFGLAKIVKGTQATTTGARAMTPGYSSPEQYGTARTDERSDIYSLGATLYAALTNTIPEDGLARAMEQADLTPIRKRNPKVSRRLAIVIEKALEVHPEDRYQTAEEFKLDLLQASTSTKQLQYTEEMTVPPPPPEVIEEIAKGQGIEAKGAQTPPPASGISKNRLRRQRRERVRRNILALLVIIFSVGAIWFQLGMPGKQYLAGILPDSWLTAQPQRPTSTPTATQTPTEAPDTVTKTPTQTGTPTRIVNTRSPSETVTETAIPSPTFTATRTATLPGGTSTPTLVPLPGQETPTATPVDFTYPVREEEIAFVSDRSGSAQIWLYAIDGGFLQQLTAVEGGACQPTWSPEGRRIAFISPCSENKAVYLNTYIYVLDIDTFEISKLTMGEGSFDPAWSPDGTKLLFVQAYDLWTSDIFVLHMLDGDIELMTGDAKLNLNPAWSPDGDRVVFASTRTDAYYLYIMPDDPGFEPVRLTYVENRKVLSPTWSSVDEIVFTEGPLDSFVSLMKVSPDMLGIGAHEYEQTRMDIDTVFVPEQDPDFNTKGSWIAYESWPDSDNHDIYLMRFDAQLVHRITTDEAYDFDPAWRPLKP